MTTHVARSADRLTARRGTTLVELVVALAIASVLLGITFGALTKVSAQRSAISARDSYLWMTRRARAAAIQRGTRVRVALVPATARATVAISSSNRVLDQVYFASEFGTRVTITGDSLTIQYDPRGLAVGMATTPTVQFTRGGSTARARVQLLGQVEAIP